MMTKRAKNSTIIIGIMIEVVPQQKNKLLKIRSHLIKEPTKKRKILSLLLKVARIRE